MLKLVHPSFRPVVEEALRSAFDGGPVVLTKVTSNTVSLIRQNEEEKGHYFTFSLPYGGTRVEWEVLFQPDYPDRSPDFLCASEDIEHDPRIYTDIMEDWDGTSIFHLANLLRKLNSVYKLYQIQLVTKHPAIMDICTSLTEAGIPDYDIEPCYLSQSKKFNLLIKLGINNEDLPIPENTNFPIQIYAGLLFSLSANGSILSESLVLSPYLESVLGSKLGQMQVPSHSSPTLNGRFIHDFTRSLQTILNKIRDVQRARRNIVASLLALFQENVVHYDEIHFSELTLLCSVNESRYAVHFKLDEEPEMALFALDRPLKIIGDKAVETPTVYFNETNKFPINWSSSKGEEENFVRHLEEFVSERLKKFVANATSATHTIPIQK